MGATTGPLPALRVCTWVVATSKGGVMSTRGAVVSVDPVTATLPTVPFSVHSGAPVLSGANEGQALAGDAGVVAIWVTDAELGDDVSVFDEQPESIVTRAAALAARAMGVVRRWFTIRDATRWPVGADVRRWPDRTPRRRRNW